MLPELAKLQDELKQKAADKLEEVWNNSLTDSEKVGEDPERFLSERFPTCPDVDQEDAISLRSQSISICIKHYTSPLGLKYKYISGSKFDEPPMSEGDGRTASAVHEKLRGIRRARKRAEQRAEKEAQAIIDEAHSEVLRASKNQGWDVTEIEKWFTVVL
ncbi:hypothetical protein BTUL_0126g00220 [Botrytis tulipae]|uniref:Uncharacterized protein n=1 Tax=Botrytis tulipae TaxID=87230 RepID=A0A4Z1EJM9_9HELO|nr:hypothetical protein BTUL_0126g00220 [Botrytis tulipae]